MKIVWIVLLGSVLLMSCTDNAAQVSKELANQLMEVWRTGDQDLLEQIASPDIVYEDVPNTRLLTGIDAAAAWRMTAIQFAAIPGRVPVATNRPIQLHGITTIEVANGKIVRAADYMDTLGFVMQLGATIELPGGVRLSLDKTTDADTQESDEPR